MDANMGAVIRCYHSLKADGMERQAEELAKFLRSVAQTERELFIARFGQELVEELEGV